MMQLIPLVGHGQPVNDLAICGACWVHIHRPKIVRCMAICMEHQGCSRCAPLAVLIPCVGYGQHVDDLKVCGASWVRIDCFRIVRCMVVCRLHKMYLPHGRLATLPIAACTAIQQSAVECSEGHLTSHKALVVRPHRVLERQEALQTQSTAGLLTVSHHCRLWDTFEAQAYLHRLKASTPPFPLGL